VLSPASIVDANARWSRLSAHKVRRTFTVGEHTVAATLICNDNHDLAPGGTPGYLLAQGRHGAQPAELAPLLQ